MSQQILQDNVAVRLSKYNMEIINQRPFFDNFIGWQTAKKILPNLLNQPK